MRPAGALVALLVSSVVLAGCPRVVHPVEPPVVEVVTATVDDALVLALRVTNPNADAMACGAVDWELAVDDRVVVRGRGELAATISARGSGDVAVQAVVPPGQRARLAAVQGERSVAGTLHCGRAQATFYGVLVPATRASSGAR